VTFVGDSCLINEQQQVVNSKRYEKEVPNVVYCERKRKVKKGKTMSFLFLWH